MHEYSDILKSGKIDVVFYVLLKPINEGLKYEKNLKLPHTLKTFSSSLNISHVSTVLKLKLSMIFLNQTLNCI